MFQTEGHAPGEFATRATQRPKHSFETFSSQFPKLCLARTFLLRLFGGVCRKHAIVALVTMSTCFIRRRETTMFSLRPQILALKYPPYSLTTDKICASCAASSGQSGNVGLGMCAALTFGFVMKEYLGFSFSISFKFSSYFWPWPFTSTATVLIKISVTSSSSVAWPRGERGSRGEGLRLP